MRTESNSRVLPREDQIFVSVAEGSRTKEEGSSHVRISCSVRHWNIIWIVIEWVNVQAMVIWTASKLSKQVCDKLLFFHCEVVLRGSKENNTSFTYRRLKISESPGNMSSAIY